ncbi:MAG TPA: CARDB domain-containing protein [Actinomycetota bacterium]
MSRPFRRIAVPILMTLTTVAAFVSAGPSAAAVPPRADLTVTDASFIVRTVEAGGDLEVKATIANTGNKAAKDFVVAIEFRGHKLAPGWHIDTLDSKAKETIHVHGQVNKSEIPGGSTAKVCADAFNAVPEGPAHEGNNCKEVGTALVNGLVFYKVMKAKAVEDTGGTVSCWKVTLDDPVEYKFQSSPEPFEWAFEVVKKTIKITVDGPITGDILMPAYKVVGQGGDCTGTLSQPSRTEFGGFTALLKPVADAEGIRVAWPDIGTVDTLGPLDCEVANPWTKPQLITEVPWSKLDSTEPFTIKLSAHVDVKNNGGNCPNAYEYSVTLQRVSEAGHPL